jgi:hypothetical protein
MKNLLHIFTLIISTVMFSSLSHADWTRVGENGSGMTFYVDFEKIIKHDGYVFWYGLINLLKPDKDGDTSYKGYRQGDCKLVRYKYLTSSFHKEPMGGGTGVTVSPKNPEWKYPNPNSVKQVVLETVCNK